MVEDTVPFLQAIRLEVRPRGPEVDGLLGAAALASTRVELDYLSPETRAIFSCDPVAAAPAGTATGTANNNCRAVGRCPRLPGSGQQRACFGLPAHGLPEICEDADACESDRLSAVGGGAAPPGVDGPRLGRACAGAAARPRPSATPATPPPGTSPRPRIAITELTLAGEGAAPALAMQLQDGFVLALVRAGIDVLDSTDVAKRLAGAPELQGCETSPCLKRTGDLLGVPFVIRVKVDNVGNSYKMTARLFSTQGAAPAALPVAAQSRACDVCTAQEAREQMIRLADGLRPRIEEHTALPAPPPSQRDDGPRAWPAWTAVGTGLLGVVAGALVIRSAEQRNASAALPSAAP